MDSLESLVEEFGSKEGVAKLFGVLLYTDEHSNIKKVLRDDDHWLSFHELTGDRFCVFSVKPEKGVYEFSAPSGGSLGFMVEIWKEPKENKRLLEVFELENTKKLPMLLLFTQIRGEYLKIELGIDDTSEENAYRSIREQLEFSCEALEKIKEENLKKPEGLYASVHMQNDHRNRWKMLRKSLDLYSYLKGLLP